MGTPSASQDTDNEFSCAGWCCRLCPLTSNTQTTKPRRYSHPPTVLTHLSSQSFTEKLNVTLCLLQMGKLRLSLETCAYYLRRAQWEWENPNKDVSQLLEPALCFCPRHQGTGLTFSILCSSLTFLASSLAWKRANPCGGRTLLIFSETCSTNGCSTKVSSSSGCNRLATSEK